MRPSVTKSKLFVLALLLAFLSSAVPSLATQKSAFMRVYDLKAGHSNRGEVNGNPINYADPSGLSPDLGDVRNGLKPSRRKFTQQQYEETISATVLFLIRWSRDSFKGNTRLVGNLSFAQGVGNIEAGEGILQKLAGASMQTTKFAAPSNRKIFVNRDDLDLALTSNSGPAGIGANLLHESVHLEQGASRFLSIPILNAVFEWAAINEWEARKVFNENRGGGVQTELQNFYESLPPNEQKRYNPHGVNPFAR